MVTGTTSPPDPTLSDLVRRRVRQDDFGGDALLVCDNVVRIYRSTGVEVVALQGLDLVIERGELTAVVGPSGSGKSTLLSILSGLDTPTAGAVRVAGHDLTALGRSERLHYRRQVVGFVWQQTTRNLLGYLTARENVELVQGLAGVRPGPARDRADELLELLGVADCADRRPGALSGGEQQRVAIAVSLANAPEVLFADEPTGELDSATAEDVFGALRHANAELGVTVLVVTHDAAVSSQVRRTVSIRDGRTSTETLRHADDAGDLHAQEYAVLDRVGRLQLPNRFTAPLQMSRRVRLELEQDHIGVWPDGATAADEPAEQDGAS